MSLLTKDPGTFFQAPQQQETDFRSVKASASIIQIFSEIRFCCFDAVNDNDDIDNDGLKYNLNNCNKYLRFHLSLAAVENCKYRNPDESTFFLGGGGTGFLRPA